MIKYVDLFCGIGGFRLGMEQAASEMFFPIECVFSSDIDKNAARVYNKNWPMDNIKLPNDIRKQINYPDFDILFAGFPCQPYSSLGRRTGKSHSSGDLINIIIEILIKKQPRFFILENVKGLINIEKGSLFMNILLKLKAAGYNVQYKLLNSKYFGVPQSRDRVYIVGIHTDFPDIYEFPREEKENFVSLKSILQTVNIQETDLKIKRMMEIEKMKMNSGTKLNPAWAVRIVDIEGIAGCLIQCQIGGIMNLRNIIDCGNNTYRQLTPIECERLQGYPDDWTSCQDVLCNKRIELLGNSVTIPVIKQLCKKLIKCYLA